MPVVHVKLVALLREAVGEKDRVDIEIKNTSTKLRDVINKLFAKYPRLRTLVEELGKRGLDVLFVLNGKETNLDAEVRDGDEIVILPPASGG
jgi:molybdopterin synthase sulfur carrier subunit